MRIALFCCFASGDDFNLIADAQRAAADDSSVNAAAASGLQGVLQAGTEIVHQAAGRELRDDGDDAARPDCDPPADAAGQIDPLDEQVGAPPAGFDLRVAEVGADVRPGFAAHQRYLAAASARVVA